MEDIDQRNKLRLAIADERVARLPEMFLKTKLVSREACKQGVGVRANLGQ